MPTEIAGRDYDKPHAQDHREKIEQGGLYRFLFEESLVVNLVLSLDGIILDVNRQGLRSLGYSKEDALGQPFTNFVVPEEREFVGKRLQEVMRGEKPWGADISVYAKDGTVRTYMTAPGCAILHRDGQPYGAIFSATDITERKRAEEKLQETQRKLEALVKDQRSRIRFTEEQLSKRQQAMEAVYSMAVSHGADLESLFDRAAVSILQILDLSSTAVLRFEQLEQVSVARADNDSVTHLSKVAVNCPLLAALVREKGPVQFNNGPTAAPPDCPCFAGVPFRSYIGVPIVGADDSVVGAICCFDERERSMGDFEVHLIRIFAVYLAYELNRTTMEERLRQSREMELLGRLTSGVAHEVRNPLSAIQALVEALELKMKGVSGFEPYRKHLVDQVTRLAKLMNDLLALARPVQAEAKKVLSVNELLSEALGTDRLGTHNAMAPVIAELPEEADQWRVCGDREKLQSALLNLLENARLHTPVHGRVRLVVDRLGADMVRIRVID
ncbi:MAG: PAS domain S-box protein, partial [Chitinivibrionales bacterium]|nr:PAS domain S-box protein [Chitinivibrionales bacterium]